MDEKMSVWEMHNTLGKKISAVFKVVLACALVLTLTPITKAFAEEENSQAQLLGLKLDISNTSQGVIEGTVFVDTNANGELDSGEVSVKDCKVTYGAPEDKISIYDEVRTDAQGKFTFSGVADGAYTVRVLSQAISSQNYISTLEANSNDPVEETITLEAPIVETEPEPEALEESEPVIEPEEESSLPEESEEASLTPEAGTSIIKGVVWLDENEDGIRDASENGISGYSVTLYAEDSVVKVAVTDTEGAYEFSGLVEGSYKVGLKGQSINDTSYLIPIKMLQTGSDNKFDLDSSDESSQASVTDEIVLASDATIENINAGVRDGGQAMAPMAGGTLSVPASSITTSNLQSVLEGLYSPTDIAAATTLEITGSGTLGLGEPGGTSTSISYLNTLNIDTLDCSMYSGTLSACVFRGANKVTTVTIGNSVTSLPSMAFHGCRSLTTISNSLANAQVAPGVIDLEKTGITILDTAGNQFGGCYSISTVTLGNSITALPGGIFLACTSLKTISNTLVNAKGVSADVIDLEKTGVTTLETSGNQFAGCSSLVAVTVGTSISSLPVGVFQSCTSLKTLSNTLVNAQGASVNIIDLEKTGITTLETGGRQFTYSSSLTTVALGSGITSLPQTIFYACTSLNTVSDTATNAQGVSANVIDLEKTGVVTLETGGIPIRCLHTWLNRNSRIY